MVSFSILTNTDNEILLRTIVEEFLQHNCKDTTIVGGNILEFGFSHEKIYADKSFIVTDTFYVELGEYAKYQFFDVNYCEFKNGFMTTTGVVMNPNFIINIYCEFLEKETSKFALGLADKILGITKGFMGTDQLSNYLLKRYADDILLTIHKTLSDDETRYIITNFYLLKPDLVKEIIKKNLLIEFEP